MDQDELVIFQMMTTIASNSNDLFTSHEMKEEVGQSTRPTIDVQDVLGNMQIAPTIFKS